MELLIQLKDELGRLYIAGSKNAVNDPRIKKYIEPLGKLAEKSKVFEALKVGVQGLVEGTEDDSFANLSKVFALVNSILTTQIEFSYTESEVKDLVETEKIYTNVVSYKSVENCYKHYQSNAWNNTDDTLLQEIVEIINNDCRVYKYIDRYYSGSNRLDYLNPVLVAVDNTLASYFLFNYKSKNTLGCLDRLEYIHYKFKDCDDIFDNKVIPLAKDIINNKFAEVVPEAIKIISHREENKPIILEFSKHKKDEYVYASLIALYIMGAEEFSTAFKALSEKNINLASDILVQLRTAKNDKMALEAAADILLEKFNEKLAKDEYKFKDRKTYSTHDENAFSNYIGVISVLSYDKYHVFFEQLLNKDYIFDYDLDWEYFEICLNNLVGSDIRYNQFIYDILQKYFDENHKKDRFGKIFVGKNQFIYYYLLVIKNLFPQEKIDLLTMEFIQYTKNNDLLAVRFRERRNSEFSTLLKFVYNKIEVSKSTNNAILTNFTLKGNNFRLKDFNEKIFDFLFNETYFFQAVMGENRNSTSQFVGIGMLLEEYFKITPKAQQYYIDKSKTFITKEISSCFTSGKNNPCEMYNFENYLIFDSEAFAELFFDILLNITSKAKTPAEVEKIMKGFRWSIRGNNIDVHYLKYNYLLEAEKYLNISSFTKHIYI